MNEFLIAISIALLVGLAGFANKYPDIYEKIYGYLWYLDITVFLGFFIWNIAVIKTETELMKIIPFEKLNNASAIVSEMTISNFYLTAGLFCFAIYINVLHYLSKVKPEK